MHKVVIRMIELALCICFGAISVHQPLDIMKNLEPVCGN